MVHVLPGPSRLIHLGLFASGCLASSFAFFSTVDAFLGRAARERLEMTTRLVVAGALFGLLLLMDAVRLWAGRRTSIGLNRQTPYDWPRRHGWSGVVGWGLDTGTPVSTIRASPLPTLGLILVAAGFGGWWVGLGYGVGFVSAIASELFFRPKQRRHVADVSYEVDDLLRRQRALTSGVRILMPSGLAAGGFLAAGALGVG